MSTARRLVVAAVVFLGVAIAAMPPRSPVRFTRLTNGPAATDRASTGGVAWIDIDGDGDLDLFVTNGYDVSKRPSTPQTDRLYLNDGRGNFTPAPPGPLNSDTAYSSGQAWGDYDNDGDPDVLVATQLNRPDILYRNEGHGVFSIVTEGPLVNTPGSTFGASWADVDNDGNLDLLSVNGGLSGRGINALFRNLVGGRFERILEGHLVTDSTGHAGSAWGDYDNDGDLDLYVGNTVFSPPTSHLYRNDGNFRLTRVTDSPVVTDSGPTLGGAWGDYDNDGDLDLAVTTPNGYVDWLYRNEGNGRFVRATDTGDFGIDGNGDFALHWVDYDNDGDLDLFAANWGAPSVLYTNMGNGRFDRFDHGDLGRLITTAASTSWGDIDGDGDLDLIVGTWPNYPGPLEEDHIYRNESPARGWLGVRLAGTRSNRSGIGARVTVRAHIGGQTVTQMRELVPTTSFRSHDPLELHFGLGDADRVDDIEVRWPSGIVQRLGAQRARQRIAITESGG
jgi:ASPIC/UnbV protein/VCBS repeat protein